MKKILVGFNQPKLIKEITKYVQNTNAEELVFTMRQTKASILSAIAEGKYDIALLMEECGNDVWSADEIVQIKDSYNIAIIPIISESYKETKDMVTFCNYGITSAIFIRKNGTYKADEIIRMIYSPRTLKEARAYYGISTVSDNRSSGGVLDEIVFEQVRNTIVNASGNETIGERFVRAISDLTTAQVGDLIKRLDSATLDELKKTLEFYDVLDILKKSKVIKSYRVPKDIKHQQKVRASRKTVPSEDAEDVEEAERELQFETVIDIPAENVKEFEYEEEDVADFDEFSEEDISFAEEGAFTEEELEQFGFSSEPQEGTYSESGEHESEFSFSEEMQIEKAEPEAVVEKPQMPKKESSISTAKNSKRKEKNPAPATSKKLSELDEIEDDSVTEKTDVGKVLMIAGVSVVGIIFVIILAVLFVRITMQRKAEEALKKVAPSGYDTLYNAEDVARYEIADNGNVVLYDENGNVLYNSGPEGATSDGATGVTVPEEEMDFSVMFEEDEIISDTVQQTYNDTSGFENGMDYKGLDLINMLNGNQGANCTLRMKNGASVSITRGSASIEDFKPSGIYRCQKTDSELYFDER